MICSWGLKCKHLPLNILSISHLGILTAQKWIFRSSCSVCSKHFFKLSKSWQNSLHRHGKPMYTIHGGKVKNGDGDEKTSLKKLGSTFPYSLLCKVYSVLAHFDPYKIWFAAHSHTFFLFVFSPLFSAWGKSPE